MVEEFYNENDAGVAGWLRELMTVGLIPQGYVDERDIREVRSEDVRGYTRAHFFAGVAGWPHALRLAGWPDDRPVWTGSCPCQPFSSAGKRKGEADERHLWPELLRLIAECRPPVVFGEQVASGDGRKWLAGVRADLEALGYAVGAADLCAAGAGEEAEGWVRRGDSFAWERIVVGAPHIRQRLYWVADAGRSCIRDERQPLGGEAGRDQGEEEQRKRFRHDSGDGRDTGGVADRVWEGRTRGLPERHEVGDQPASGHGDGRVGHPVGDGPQGVSCPRPAPGAADGTRPARGVEHPASNGRVEGRAESGGRGAAGGCGDGFWSAFDIIPCRDGKARRVEPASQCMVDGLPVELASRWYQSLETIKAEVIGHASATATGPGEVLRALRDAVLPEYLRWCSGRSGSLQPAAVLFAALCELSGQLGNVLDGEAPGVAEVLRAGVRAVRQNREPSRPPQGRGLPEQRPRELGNLVRQLSQEVAPIAAEVAPFILNGQPLVDGLPGRVGLLRGYGNAIVPQVAAEFIKAYLSIGSET